MGKEDYISTGGTLKLKGVKDGGIKKKKKKKKDSSVAESPEAQGSSEPSLGKKTEKGAEEEGEGMEGEEEPEEDYYAGKTEAERRFEERKRKMVIPVELLQMRPKLIIFSTDG